MCLSQEETQAKLEAMQTQLDHEKSRNSDLTDQQESLAYHLGATRER